ncbi:hypothetical protein [Burkholderia anthina]|uniref:hypothetical protein n=1 Tax=Burkholderia anthina TaxID=179879 RepID=UPI0015883A7D|nr:hypothetical protein [Burkholderia anthina]
MLKPTGIYLHAEDDRRHAQTVGEPDRVPQRCFATLGMLIVSPDFPPPVRAFCGSIKLYSSRWVMSASS